MFDAVTDALLAFDEPDAGVVGAFVADVAVHFEHAVDVFEHVFCDGAAEGVLGVGVHVHFDDSMAEAFLDLFAAGAGAAVEDEIEVGGVAMGGFDEGLAVAKDLGAEFEGAGADAAVDVAKGGGEQVAALVFEGVVDAEHLFGGGVEVGVAGFVLPGPFVLTSDDADFQFEDEVEVVATGEEGAGLGEVVVEAEAGAVEHVGMEEIGGTGHTTLGGFFEERHEEALDVRGRAMVAVEGDEDVVMFGEAVSGFCEHHGAFSGIVDGGAGGEGAASGEDLEDAIRLCFGESAKGAVDGGDGSDVDSGKGEAATAGGIQHGVVLLSGGDGHGVCRIRLWL